MDDDTLKDAQRIIAESSGSSPSYCLVNEKFFNQFKETIDKIEKEQKYRKLKQTFDKDMKDLLDE